MDQKKDGNGNGLKEEVMKNIEPDAEGIVQERRTIVAFMEEVK